jgi:hypothetical protein
LFISVRTSKAYLYFNIGQLVLSLCLLMCFFTSSFQLLVSTLNYGGLLPCPRYVPFILTQNNPVFWLEGLLQTQTQSVRHGIVGGDLPDNGDGHSVTFEAAPQGRRHNSGFHRGPVLIAIIAFHVDHQEILLSQNYVYSQRHILFQYRTARP